MRRYGIIFLLFVMLFLSGCDGAAPATAVVPTVVAPTANISATETSRANEVKQQVAAILAARDATATMQGQNTVETNTPLATATQRTFATSTAMPVASSTPVATDRPTDLPTAIPQPTATVKVVPATPVPGPKPGEFFQVQEHGGGGLRLILRSDCLKEGSTIFYTVLNDNDVPVDVTVRLPELRHDQQQIATLKINAHDTSDERNHQLIWPGTPKIGHLYFRMNDQTMWNVTYNMPPC
jgi:hypothetical protein